ncbi:Putrescine transport ATP-binding protein PotA [Acidisarcina polymorpha]|uniref:Putrescine transport ATP-binding protein PotA n=1 Tax=Acidisarcina polymorpha TaxID=2211140 RepID=A0A2Z5G1V0_9BACT|nr:ABC transporter ATP-binding protein [Acidisarcina polymorpha]AXC13059.1 Putrescine transport ATP-binding protein PotA [Acidisarcina polymorpha]
MTPAPPFLQLRSVGKIFGKQTVLDSIDLNIESGEFLTILGESGSGKTTLLRILAGFEEPTSGDILLEGKSLLRSPAFRRPINTVFQNYALFPHLSVFDNVAYGLRVGGIAKPEIQERVQSALRLVKMGAFADRWPRQLSGGQKQRVALARALVNRPRALLLDEPLSALDANLRSEMQRELKLLQRELGITFLFVTHDQEEAMAMSDRIVLLYRGRIEQCAPPRDIYLRPRTSYVASFIGKSNLLRGRVVNGVANCGFITVPIDSPDGPIVLSLRPEAVKLEAEGVAANRIRFTATIELQQFQGANALLSLCCDDGTRLSAQTRSVLQADTSVPVGFTCDPQDFVRVEDTQGAAT